MRTDVIQARMNLSASATERAQYLASGERKQILDVKPNVLRSSLSLVARTKFDLRFFWLKTRLFGFAEHLRTGTLCMRVFLHLCMKV